MTEIELIIVSCLLLIVYGIWQMDKIEKTKHFKCKNCEAEFKVSKYKLLVTAHWGSKQYLKCHACKRRSWMCPEDD